MSLSSDLTTAFDSLSNDLAECPRNLGDRPVFTWNGQSVRLLPSSSARATMLEMGGLGVDVGLSLITLREYFFAVDDSLDVIDNQVVSLDDQDLPVPIAGRRLTYLGQTYTIVSTKLDPTQTVIRLDLKDPSR
jgi:hypothetical protein